MYRIIGADGREYGPITADQVRVWIAEGRANAQTRALAEGTIQWKPLIEFLEFAPALASSGAGWRTPGPVTMPRTTRTNSLALTSMIMGIFSLTCGLCCCYGLPFNVLGLIFALVSLVQIRKDPLTQQGKGVAIAGLVLCLLSLALAAIFSGLGLALNMPDLMREIRKL